MNGRTAVNKDVSGSSKERELRTEKNDCDKIDDNRKENCEENVQGNDNTTSREIIEVKDKTTKDVEGNDESSTQSGNGKAKPAAKKAKTAIPVQITED